MLIAAGSAALLLAACCLPFTSLLLLLLSPLLLPVPLPLRPLLDSHHLQFPLPTLAAGRAVPTSRLRPCPCIAPYAEALSRRPFLGSLASLGEEPDSLPATDLQPRDSVDLTDLADGEEKRSHRTNPGYPMYRWYGASGTLAARCHARLGGHEPDPRFQISVAAPYGNLHLGSPRFAIVPPLPPADVTSGLPYLPQQPATTAASQRWPLTAMVGYRAGTLQRFSGFHTGADMTGSHVGGKRPFPWQPTAGWTRCSLSRSGTMTPALSAGWP